MRVHIGSDHAGFELKNHLVAHLREQGTTSTTARPSTTPRRLPAVLPARGRGVVAEPGSLGIVIGGSGNGEQIAANKVQGVRAALAWSNETAALARQHNNANVISVGARMHTPTRRPEFVDAFLATPFSGEERHDRRIDMLAAYETTGELPPLPPGAPGSRTDA